MTFPIIESDVGKLRLADDSILNHVLVAGLETDISQYKLGDDGLYSGKSFDALVAGTFHPGNWPTPVTFLDVELDTYLENTLKAIDGNRDEDGAVVGLPIDTGNHDHKEAGGWIIGASIETLDGGRRVLRFEPKWNEAGIDLIASHQYRWFSGDIDTVNKVILGGTLTNWPAVRSEEGKNMLRPLQLEKGKQVAAFGDNEDESINQFIRKVADAFLSNEPFAWILEVYEDYIIADIDNALFSIAYELVEDTPMFTEKKNWEEVKQSYIAADEADDRPGLLGKVKSKLSGIKKIITEESKPDNKALNKPEPNGGSDMDITKVAPELLSEIEIAAYERLMPRNEGESDEDYLERIEALGTVGANMNTGLFSAGFPDLNASSRVMVEAELARLEAKRDQDVKEAIARMAHEAAITNYSTDVTAAKNPEYLGGIPVEAGLIRDFMNSLNGVQLPKFKSILESVLKNGLVDFDEIGNGKKSKGITPLPEGIGAELESYLNNGKARTIAKFFNINADLLGDMDEYDLAEFKTMEAK